MAASDSRGLSGKQCRYVPKAGAGGASFSFPHGDTPDAA